MSVNQSADSGIYKNDTAFTQGILLSRLESKLVEVRSYNINWEPFYQGRIISAEDYEFISSFDQLEPEGKDKLYESYPEQCVLTIFTLFDNKLAREHIIQYLLVMLDDLIAKDKARVGRIHEILKEHKNINIWPPFTSLLNRDDPIVMHMAGRLFAKFASFSEYRCSDSDLIYYINWLKSQLCAPFNEYLKSVSECIQWMTRIDDYRMPFAKADGINSIVSLLLNNLGFQLQYQLIFSLWMLSFNQQVAGKIAENNVIPILADILRDSQKEKVTRVIIATFRNLLKFVDSKSVCVSLIQCKLLPVFNVLANKSWEDEDIKDDIEYIQERVNNSVQDLSTWDEYVAEVKSGRLEWSPVHRQEKFWRENAIKVCEGNYELLKILINILHQSEDPLIQAVACHDLGEFIRHYPRAKPAFDALGCKELIMQRMSHENENVKYEALLAVQKLLVHNWEFLGKQIKVE